MYKVLLLILLITTPVGGSIDSDGIQRMIAGKQIDCIAKTVYFEARGESEEGKIAIANVVLNRFKSGNYNDFCSVVYQNRQFSWTLMRRRKIKEEVSWKESRLIANDIYYDNLEDNTYGATHFHKSTIKPRWIKSFRKVAVIGNHVFYIKKNK